VFSVGLNCMQIDLDFLQKQVTTKYQVKLSASTEYLHGAGPSFVTSYDLTTGVPLQVIGTLQSRAYVVGKMIKSDFSNSFSCNNWPVPTPHKVAVTLALKPSCGQSHQAVIQDLSNPSWITIKSLI
jgi:hypothetical protein